MDYDESSFLAGVAVGRSLKGWSGGFLNGAKQFAPCLIVPEVIVPTQLSLVEPLHKPPYLLTEFEEVT